VTDRTSWGIAFALTGATIYGLVPNFSRAAFENGISSFETTFVRTATVVLFLAIIAILSNQRLTLPLASMPAFIGQVIAAAVVSICYLAAGQYIPVGLAGIIFFTFPVIILLMAPIMEGHPPDWRQIALALFAFAGLAIAMASDFSSLDIRGVLFAAAGALGCTLQAFSGRAMARYATPAVFGTYVHLAILPLTFLVAVYMNGGKMHVFDGEGVAPVAYAFIAGVGICYMIAYLAHMMSVRHAPASVVAPFYNLEPVVTAGVAAAFLGERLSPSQYLGGSMVISAIVIAGILDLRGRKAVSA
jgi:drug/metabolite transporter (DMT)-like permease